MKFLLVILSANALMFQLSLAASSSMAMWGYKDEGPGTGPSSWAGACSGRVQSPINIPKSGNPIMTAKPFEFLNYDSTPKKNVLLNKQTSIKLEMEPVKPEMTPRVSEGGLPGTFQFAQMHFHWGTTDNRGSEHTISKVAFPMELHLVHYNTKYGTDLNSAISGGAGAQDTLAVLGIMFSLQSKPNKKLEPIIQGLEEIPNRNNEADIDLFPLKDVLPLSTDSFYRYNGSLTTPACNEIVVWTVFKDPLDISSRQMERFRQVAARHERMQNNFRPVQPLNGRTVYEMDTTGAAMAASAPTKFMALTITTLVTYMMN